jgi:hypothetical protein
MKPKKPQPPKPKKLALKGSQEAIDELLSNPEFNEAMKCLKMKMTINVGVGTPPPEGAPNSGKTPRRSKKALTTVHDLRDRVQLYWYGSKRNRLCFPIDDHSDGWIAYENEKKAEAARQQLLSQLSPLGDFELGRAFEIVQAFHEHDS